MQNRTHVLLTEGSSSSARQALYSLNRFTVDIVDPARLCQCRFSSLVRRWYRCPSYAQDPAAYLRFIVGRIATGHYDVLLPTHEQVYLLAYFRDAFERRVGLAVPEFEAVRRLQSKVEFARVCQEVGLRAPEFQIIGDESDLQSVTTFPCFLKLAHGTGGLGVKRIHDQAELKREYQAFRDAGLIHAVSEVLVQQPAKGNAGVVQSVFQHGRLLAAHCSEPRLVGLGGGQMIRESAVHQSVWADLEKLGRSLQWHGALFLDYFHDPETGQLEYVEANPRLGETLSARLCGANLCELMVGVSRGQTVEPLPPTQPGVWSHNGFQVLLARAIQGANRRDLIGELWQLLRGQGIYHAGENETTRVREDCLSIVPACAVVTQLLVQPKLADRIVRGTIENYALPEAGVQRIEQLPKELAEDYFRELGK